MNVPKHYSLKEDNNDHFVIHDQRDDTHFKVSKKNVHPATQIKIMRLQKFEDGGMAKDVGIDMEKSLRSPDYPLDDAPVVSQDAPMDVAPPAPHPQMMSTPPVTPGWQAPMLPGQGAGEMPVQPQGPVPQINPQNAPVASADTMAQFQGNQNLEQQGLKTKMGAEIAQGNEMAKTYQDAQSNLKDLLYKSQQDAWNQQVDNENLSQEVANAKVDPKRLFHNMSTGQKIFSMIGVVLGGIGAGMTHGPNLGLQVIQKAIDDDIDAQKADLGKKQSLLSNNLQKYRDMKTAEQATALQMNSIVQGQIAATSAKYGGQSNAGATQMMLGQLGNKNLQDSQVLKQTMFDQQLRQHLQQGDVSGQNPLDYVRHVVPADKQKDVATELGKAMYTTDNKEKMLHLWDQAQKEQTAGRTVFGIWDAPATKALRAMGDPLIHDQEGRVNEFEKKDFEGLLPGSGQVDSRQKELRKSFEMFLDNKREAPLAKTQGIDIDRFKSTSSPSSETKVVNGVKYMRGPKGEAIPVK